MIVIIPAGRDFLVNRKKQFVTFVGYQINKGKNILLFCSFCTNVEKKSPMISGTLFCITFPFIVCHSIIYDRSHTAALSH